MMGVNVKAAIAVTAGMTAIGVAASQFGAKRIDEIHASHKPETDWAREANEAFAGVTSPTPDDIARASAYMRDKQMPSGIDANISSYGISFSRKYDKDAEKIGNLAALPAFAIVGGGFFALTGAILATTRGGTTGLTAGPGVALAAAGVGMLGGYFGSELLRNRG